MHGGVGGQFGMECSDQQLALANQDGTCDRFLTGAHSAHFVASSISSVSRPSRPRRLGLAVLPGPAAVEPGLQSRNAFEQHLAGLNPSDRDFDLVATVSLVVDIRAIAPGVPIGPIRTLTGHTGASLDTRQCLCRYDT